MRASDNGRAFRGAVIRDAGIGIAGTLEPPPTTASSRFLHLTLPAGTVRDVAPCALGPGGIAVLRESVLPKLVRGSVVLPTRPRYRLGGVITADGGRLFELRARHGDLVVARIGIGWRDYGADLVWQACASGAVNEPPRPWLVEVLEQASIARLNSHEAVGIVHWVSALARDLAWAVMDGHIFWRGPATPRFGPLTRGSGRSRAPV